MGAVKTISRKEVALHKTEEDLWTIIRGNVYNVTAFADEHPGGVDTLLDVAGGDGTEEYDSVGHSDSANDMLKKYIVGTVDPADVLEGKAGKSAAGGSVLTIAIVVGLLAVVAFLIVRE
jgi:cytochrome b involved in lipid metabolism